MSTSSLNLSESKSITPLLFSDELNLLKHKQTNQSESSSLNNFENSRNSSSKVFSLMGTSDALTRRAVSISYMTKALKKKQKKNNSEDKNCTPVKTKSSETDGFDFLSDSDSITTPYSPGYFVSDREDFPDSIVGKNFSPQTSSSSNQMALLNTLEMPQRASVDLSIPLDPTMMSTPEERRLNPTRSGSAQEIMEIEKRGENLFNSSIRNSQSSSGSLSPALDPSIRFSTADAKRLSIISMTGKNSNTTNANRIPTSQPSAGFTGELLQPSSFKNPFSLKSHEPKNSVGASEADAFSIRNKMSLRRKSWSSSPPALSTEVPETLYKKPPSGAGKRRRSSLLASGDVLSMKMGVLKRTSSSRKDENPSFNNNSDFSDSYEEALEATPDSYKSDFIDYNYGKNDNSILRAKNKKLSYLEVGPLESQPGAFKMKKPCINLSSDDNRDLSPNSQKSFLGDNVSMRNRVQSIAENTRDQLRRSTIISSSSLSSGSSATNFHKNQDLKPDYHDFLDFQYIKTPESPSAPIDLDKAKSNSEEPSESAKKFVWMDMI